MFQGQISRVNGTEFQFTFDESSNIFEKSILENQRLTIICGIDEAQLIYAHAIG